MVLIPARRLADGISADVPDWSRERHPGGWSPSHRLVAAFRSYERSNGKGGPFAKVGRGFAVLRYRFWSAVTGAEIPLGTRIAGGLLMPHPNGIVIHHETVIGPNCLIMQQVTLGTSNGGAPTIGGHVDLGAGAKVIGAVTIGDHARIGANALVVKDVPAGAIVMAPLGEIRTAEQQTGN